MKLCLVIPGNTATRITACRVLESLGFSSKEEINGLYEYNAGEEAALDVIVLDWEQSGAGTTGLKERLEAIRKEKHAVVLFCGEGEEQEYLETVLRDERSRWLIRPFNVANLATTFLQ